MPRNSENSFFPDYKELEAINEKALNIIKKSSILEINSRLLEASKIFPTSVNYSGSSRAIRTIINNSDDYLFDMIKDSIGFDLVTRSVDSKVNEVVALLDQVPYASIYFHNFNEFTEDYYVVAVQYDENGNVPKSIEAFSSDGESTTFDINEAPDFPVVVLSISEKINTYTNLRGPLKTSVFRGLPIKYANPVRICKSTSKNQPGF